MIHEVKIYDAAGKLKRVISAKKLSRMYWVQYGRSENYVKPESIGNGSKFIRKCENCGEPFRARKKDSRYCKKTACFVVYRRGQRAKEVE